MKKLKKVIFVRDTIHKNIDISEPIIHELVATREFQRLRLISQLGGAQNAFPGATHTRYSHSLGVFHILSRVLNEVQGASKIAKEKKLLIKIAGLLHDIGHGPFSHAFEKVTNFNNKPEIFFSHEYYTCEIIRDNETEVNKVLNKYNVNIEILLAIIKKDYKKCEKYLIQLVSSQIDCDRMDYLIRDGYFTGVDYGNIDLNWIISNMNISKKDGVFFNKKAMAAIENYLITRFHMYWQIYYHKSSLNFDLKLQQLFKKLAELNSQNYAWKINIKPIKVVFEEKLMPVKEYLQLNDSVIVNLVNEIIFFETDNILVELAKNVLFSNYHQIELEDLGNISHKNEAGKNVLKNFVYNSVDEPIMIKVNENKLLPLEVVSYIVKNLTEVKVLNYQIKNKF